jgi:hypothetical protein
MEEDGGHRYFEVFSLACLEGMREITEHLGQNSLSPDQEPVIYVAGVLTI